VSAGGGVLRSGVPLELMLECDADFVIVESSREDRRRRARMMVEQLFWYDGNAGGDALCYNSMVNVG
jgi:hypothetical protein